jgi:hypothetical protein
LAPAQTPDWQLSLCVQALPSSQGVPSLSAGFEHFPVAGSQTPAAWHESLGVQTTRFAPLQAPDRQLSICVQASPSSQDVPSAASGFEHAPVAGSQVPATWQASLALQTTPAQRSAPLFERLQAASPIIVAIHDNQRR